MSEETGYSRLFQVRSRTRDRSSEICDLHIFPKQKRIRRTPRDHQEITSDRTAFL